MNESARAVSDRQRQRAARLVEEGEREEIVTKARRVESGPRTLGLGELTAFDQGQDQRPERHRPDDVVAGEQLYARCRVGLRLSQVAGAVRVPGPESGRWSETPCRAARPGLGDRRREPTVRCLVAIGEQERARA